MLPPKYKSNTQKFKSKRQLTKVIVAPQVDHVILVPGSPALMAGTVEKLRSHRVVVWSKHGVMSRSDNSVKRAGDRVEYAETGARYEYLNLTNNELGTGLTNDEVRAICAAFNIKQSIF